MTTDYKLYFVCTGNICRSPMAEGLAPVVGKKYGFQIEAQSAGTLRIKKPTAAKNSIKVMKEIGIDISSHRPSKITGNTIQWADYILVMESKHASIIRTHFPEADQKTLLLGNFGGTMDIADPIGGWKYKFRSCRKQIELCLERFFQQLQPKT